MLSASVAQTNTGGATVLARVEGSVDSLSSLLDGLVGQLLVRGAGVAAERAVGLPSSLEATRAYVVGRAANRRGSWSEAALNFGRAIALDSSFTLAALGMSEASVWLAVPLPGIRRVQELAWANRATLSPRDQALLAGYTGGNGPAPYSGTDELRAWESAVSRFPDMADAWYWLGEVYFHQGRLLGFEDHLARAKQAMDMASSLDPDMAAPMYHAIEMAAMRRDTAEAERLFARYLTHDSVSETRSILEVYVAEGVRDSAALAAVLQRFDRTGHTTSTRAPYYFRRNGRSLEWMDPFVTAATKAAGAATMRSVVEHLRLVVSLDRGHPGQAIAAARHGGAWNDATALAAVLSGGAPRAEALDARERQSRLAGAPAAATVDGRRSQYDAACLVGQWTLLLEPGGSVDALLGTLRRGASTPDDSGRPEANPACLAMIEAMQAVRDGRPDRVALVLRLDSLLQTVPPGMTGLGRASGTVDAGLEAANLVAARLLEDVGLTTQAYRAARRGPVWSLAEWPLAPHLRELGRLAVLAGETGTAVASYRHYLALRADPEPSLIAQRDSVRAELAALVNER